jgi:hypothetical protein
VPVGLHGDPTDDHEIDLREPERDQDCSRVEGRR